MSHITNCFFSQNLPENFSDCRIKKKGLVKTVQVNPFYNVTEMFSLRRIIEYKVWLFSVNRISWHSVTRSRLVYQTTYQRFSRKILPWRSKATKSPISCSIYCSVSNCKVYRKLQVWSSSLSIYCWRDVYERENTSQRTLWTEGRLSAPVMGTAGIHFLG